MSKSDRTVQPLYYRFNTAKSSAGTVLVEAGPCGPTEQPDNGIVGQISIIHLGSTGFADARKGWIEQEPATPHGQDEVRILVSLHDDELEFAGRFRRANYKDWKDIGGLFAEAEPGARVWRRGQPPVVPPIAPERVARFTSSFGEQAWQRLRQSTAVVIGAGGTGSVTIPMLARAGIGRIVIVDSDHITPSNLERTHAAFPEHVARKTPKALLARDHVRSIDPEIEVIAFEGRLPQPKILAEVARADVIIGCTDQHSSRLAVSDAARRYLVPAIDCGGLIEGAAGRVTGQIIQLVLFRPDDPCPQCRGMIDPELVKRELMSTDELAAIAAVAETRNLPPGAAEVPQIDTVGYITTVSGTLAAGYAIGWLAGRFDPPFERMQLNLIADCLDVTNRSQPYAKDCTCRASRGLADAGAAKAPIQVPKHWGQSRRLE